MRRGWEVQLKGQLVTRQILFLPPVKWSKERRWLAGYDQRWHWSRLGLSHEMLFSLFAALWVQLFGSVTQWFLFQAQWWLHEVAWARGVEDWRTECGSSVSVTRGRGLRIKVVKGGVRWGHGASAVLCKVPPLCSVLHTAVESHGMQIGKKCVPLDWWTSFCRS